MKTSFTTLGCPDWTVEEIAKNAKAYGYNGVELRTHIDGNHFHPDASPDEARRVAAIFRDAGTAINSIMGYTRFAFVNDADVEQNQALMRKLIGLAGAMGVPFIRSFAGGIPEGVNREAMVVKVANALKPLAREAAERGVTIGLETHDDWCSGDRVMNVVERVNSKGFGVVYDIFNAFHSGIERWDVTYAKVRKHICYCHVKDGYKGPDGKNRYVPIGAGDLPIREVLARFKADGYDGYFSFEWEKKWYPELEEPERAFPHFVHKIRTLWDETPSSSARPKIAKKAPKSIKNATRGKKKKPLPRPKAKR